MAIELAKIQLHRVHRIQTLEQATLVHHAVPGLEGTITQNLGRGSVRLQIEGIFYGARATEDLEALRTVYKKRQPVDFLAETVGQAYFSQVILERFEVAQAADHPDQFSYRLTITEYTAAEKSAAANQAAVNQAVKLDAKNLMNVAELPEALTTGLIPELTNPVEPLQGAVDQVATALQSVEASLEGLENLLKLPIDTTPTLTDFNLEPVKPAPLGWVKPPASKALLQAGLPLRNLVNSGVPLDTLLEVVGLLPQVASRGFQPAAIEGAKATVMRPLQDDILLLMELQAAGVAIESLAAAGVAVELLHQSTQALEASFLDSMMTEISAFSPEQAIEQGTEQPLAEEERP